MSGGAWIPNHSPIVLKLSTLQIGAGNALASTPYPPMPVITEWFVSDTSQKPGYNLITPSPVFPSSTSIQLLKYDPLQNNEQHVSLDSNPIRFGDIVYISAGGPNSPCLTINQFGASWGTGSSTTPWDTFQFSISSSDPSVSGIVPPGYNVVLFQPSQKLYLEFLVTNNDKTGIPEYPMVQGTSQQSEAGNIAFVPMQSLWWTNASMQTANKNKCVQRSAEQGFTQGAVNNNCVLGLPGSSLLYSVCTTSVPTCTQNVLGPNMINSYNYDTLKTIDSTWRPFNYQSDCVNFSFNKPTPITPWTPLDPSIPSQGPSHIPILTKQQLILIGILSVILIIIIIKLIRS